MERIDAPGSGTTSARFTVGRSGTFYLTLLSSALNSTDQDDVWVMVDAGVDEYRPSGNKKDEVWKIGN